MCSSDLTNVGDAPLGLDPLSMEAATAPFAFTSPGSTLLAPGESTTFTVTFQPDDGSAASAEIQVASNDPEDPVVPVAVTGEGLVPDLVIDPELHDFGTLDYAATDSVLVTLSNAGDATLTLTNLSYTTNTTELAMDALTDVNGELPWTLAPGASLQVRVDYAPTDDVADEGYITILSDDPDEPEAYANQIGNARAWEGFSTGWYIVDDSTNYETTSNPSYTIESYGDMDGYWYEPSGAHGLIDSADPTADFDLLHDYIIARAGTPTPVTGPLTFHTVSSVPAFTYASYSYILCDFWLDSTDDPALYSISSGTVDDGILILVNGEILGNLTLGGSGSWPLDNAVPGAVNTLIVILQDNSAVDKYLNDLAFYRDGVIVSG